MVVLLIYMGKIRQVIKPAKYGNFTYGILSCLQKLFCIDALCHLNIICKQITGIFFENPAKMGLAHSDGVCDIR